MSSEKKFHLNGSTVLSLNERFTRMQGHGGAQAANRRVEPRQSHTRSRSRSRIGPQPEHIPRISIRNRSLLAQLDQKHLLRAALKLKRKSLKVKPRNILGAIGQRQSNRASTGTLLVQNKRRRNLQPKNVAKQIATIKADLLKNIRRVRQLSRSNSKLNLNEPHNVRGRPRLNRNNNVNARITPRERSRSRSRMGQYGTNVKQNMRERSISRQRLAAPVKPRRSKSRVLGQFQTSEESKARPMRRQQIKPRSRSVQRASVNTRTQIKGRNNKNTKMKENNHISNIKRGRITRKFRQNQQRAIRSQFKKQPAQQQNGQKQNSQKQNGRQFRGKRASGQAQKQSGKRNPVKSKEQLDAELDQYMVNTMPAQDQNIGLYNK